jgi:hypothetical protein
MGADICHHGKMTVIQRLLNSFILIPMVQQQAGTTRAKIIIPNPPQLVFVPNRCAIAEKLATTLCCKPAIFYHTERQQELALQSKEQLAQSGRFDKPIVTEVLPASAFYPAEDYHQDYHKKNVKHYKEDRTQSGRDEFIDKNW